MKEHQTFKYYGGPNDGKPVKLDDERAVEREIALPRFIELSGYPENRYQMNVERRVYEWRSRESTRRESAPDDRP